MQVEPGSEPAGGRAWKIMEMLGAHPGGLSAPQLLELVDVPATSRQQALTKIGNVLRYHLQYGRVRHAGEIPGVWQRGPAIVWALTTAGLAWLEVRRTADRTQGQRIQYAGDPADDLAIGRLAADAQVIAEARDRIEAAAVALNPPGLARCQRSALIGVLWEARFTVTEIAAVTGYTHEGVRQNLIRQGKGGGKRRPAYRG